MQQLGLTEAWARPVAVPAGAQSIADQQLFVHQENPREYVEIVMVPKADATPSAATEFARRPMVRRWLQAMAVRWLSKVLARIPTDQMQANGNTDRSQGS